MKIHSIALVCALALFSACQTPMIRSVSHEDLEKGYGDYLKSYQSDLDGFSKCYVARIKAEYGKSDRKTQTYDMLILSGGGALGAFGAGYLQGWGNIQEVDWKRPEFDNVSGISTGALIAPFAFIGTAESYQEIVDLYSNPKKDWVCERGVIPIFPSHLSLYKTDGLHEKIRSVVTQGMIEKLAQGSSEKRVLMVGATNVDYGIMRVWDLADISSNYPPDIATEKINSILFASSAIPGVFPPVLIDSLLYVDGGAAMQMLGGIGNRDWAYRPDVNDLNFISKSAPVKIRIWAILNQKLLPDSKVIQPRWTSIAKRSLNILVRASTLQTLQDTETYVHLVDKFEEFEVEFRYVAIPQDYEIKGEDHIFDAEVMRELIKLGQEMGEDPTSWRTHALQPSAPFE